MNAVTTYRKRFGVAASQAILLEMLATGEPVTVDAMAAEVCFHTPSRDCVRVQIYRLRKAIAPLEITTIRHGDYRMDEPHLAMLRGFTV